MILETQDVFPEDHELVSVGRGWTLEHRLLRLAQQQPSKSGSKGKPSSSTRVLARISEHQVSDGETLESVAEMYGLTVDALAKFNWGTSAPAEIRRYLLLEVGCTRKDTQGRYVFSSEDVPGLLRIPRPVAVPRMAVEQSHILRVKKVPEPRPYLFSL